MKSFKVAREMALAFVKPRAQLALDLGVSRMDFLEMPSSSGLRGELGLAHQADEALVFPNNKGIRTRCIAMSQST